jgi:hypothetical protein
VNLTRGADQHPDVRLEGKQGRPAGAVGGAGSFAVNGTVTASLFSGSGSSLTSVNATTFAGRTSANFAQLAAANTFSAKQTMAGSAAMAPVNILSGPTPSSPIAGDVWNTGSNIQYRDNAATTRSLVNTTQSGGMQMLKLTASITPSSVSNATCSEQSFTVSGVSAGDAVLAVLQPSTTSPGTNIAIGGWRVSAAKHRKRTVLQRGPEQYQHACRRDLHIRHDAIAGSTRPYNHKT